MTKKLTIFFAILTAICVVAAVPLIPFAIRDTSNMLISTIDTLDNLEIKGNFDIDDRVNTLNIRTGNLHYRYIYIRHSDDKAITVKSDSLGFMHIDPQVITSDNIITLDLNFQGYESYFIPESAQEIRDSLARIIADKEYCTIEISVPDGLILTMDGNDLDPNNIYIDGNVRYLTTEDIVGSTSPEAPVPETESKEPFENRVQNLRSELLELVRSNAADSYDQLDFNMRLNDCRIQMESLMMEYAENEGLINYDKYKEQPSSSAATGISSVNNKNNAGVNLTPYDTSLNESEARNLIHELCGLYLSRLIVQAKLDYTIIELETSSEDAKLVENKTTYETQIVEYTNRIQEMEDIHTDFIMSLMDTGLLF